MFSKPEPLAMSWSKAIVSPEEIAALLQGIFPLNPSSLNKDQSGHTGLEGPSLHSSTDPCRPSSKISLESIF